MDRPQARLYLAAAGGDPFLAAWVSVLDRHHMHHRTDVAPYDWEDAFEELFNLELVSDEQFNAIDYKRVFRRRTPPVNDVEAALSALAALRQPASTKEVRMSKFDIFEKPEAALALRNGNEHQPLARHESLAPLAPRFPAPDELVARPVKPAAPLAPLEPTRRTIESTQSDPVGLPRQSIEDEDTEFPSDPRTYVEEFDMKLECCGLKLEIEYDDGQDVSNEFNPSEQRMIEFAWHAVCPHCHGEHHHTIVRPFPADFMPR
jgi:hypothetical protein